MHQCEMEKIEFTKGSKSATRTGVKKIAFVDGVTPDMVGAIIDMKKVEGLWVLDVIHAQDIEAFQIKRNWHVGGL